jgi:alpha-beta hydrolase superfamily lysophospholipase
MAALVPRFREQVALLGRDRSLVSIITRPTVPPAGERPAVVILNTGIIHRVGHHRMYVTLSRMLADSGHTVVRFDFSGIGDSAPAKDRKSPLAACLEQVKDVIDSVARTHDSKRFVLIGLCSGADHAILHTGDDERVAGVVLMDPTVPPTPRYYLHYVLQRLLHVRNWLSVITGRSGLMRILAAHLSWRMQGGSHPPEELNLQNLQFSPHLARSYRAAAQRSVRMLAVFTSVSPRHTYPQQILDAFPETGSSLRLEYFPESDHHFSPPLTRARLFRVIAEWLDSV